MAAAPKRAKKKVTKKNKVTTTTTHTKEVRVGFSSNDIDDMLISKARELSGDKTGKTQMWVEGEMDDSINISVVVVFTTTETS